MQILVFPCYNLFRCHVLGKHSTTFTPISFVFRAANARGKMFLLDNSLDCFIFRRYLLVGGHEGRFRVEHRTGMIKVRSLLDGVEVSKIFSLEIEAHDLGPQRRTTQTVVKIKVVDKTSPIFDQLAYSEVVREDVKVGHRICSIQARSPGGADIVYAIMKGNPRNDFFIDFNSGKCLTDGSPVMRT